MSSLTSNDDDDDKISDNYYYYLKMKIKYLLQHIFCKILMEQIGL